MQFEDILYEKAEGLATITINRPTVLNAFRALTVDELVEAFKDAWADRAIGVVILTGAATPSWRGASRILKVSEVSVRDAPRAEVRSAGGGGEPPGGVSDSVA